MKFVEGMLVGGVLTIGATVDTIKTLNNLTSNLLSIGQVLQIPNN